MEDLNLTPDPHPPTSHPKNNDPSLIVVISKDKIRCSVLAQLDSAIIPKDSLSTC